MAVLVALAVLAERAASRCYAVRLFVLWLLRRAEAVAGDFVFDATGKPPAFGGIAAIGNDPVDALHLAARLRALAAMLGVLLALVCRFGCRPRRRGFAFGHLAPSSARRLNGWTRTPNDTS